MPTLPTLDVFGMPIAPDFAPFSESAFTKLRRFRTIYDFRSPFDADWTRAFQMAIDSQAYVAIPDGDYPIAGTLLDTKGGAFLYAIGRKARLIPNLQILLAITGPSSRYVGLTIAPTSQGNTQYQLQIQVGGDQTELEDINFAEGNSGINIAAPYCNLRRIRMREMRGSCINPIGSGAHNITLDDIYMRNGCLGGILPSDGANNITARRIRKWVDVSKQTQYIKDVVAALVAGGMGTVNQLGGDVWASTSECYDNQVYDAYAADARDGSVTFSGPNNKLIGGFFKGGLGSGVAIGGDNCTVDSVTTIGQKNGIYMIPNFGGSAKRTRVSNCDARNSVEYGFCAQANTYRQWVSGMSYASDARFTYYGLNIYQCTSATQWGTIPPTHTSGTVSDGINLLTWVGSDPVTLDSDDTSLVNCRAIGSGLGDFALFGAGRMTGIGCSGTPRTHYNFPSRTGLSSAGTYDFRATTSNATPGLMTTDGAATTAANSIRLLEGKTLNVTGTIFAQDQTTGDTAEWTIDILARRGVGTAFSILRSVVTPVVSDGAASTWAVVINSQPSRYELVFTVTGQASKTILWKGLFRIEEPLRNVTGF